ncbi:MAG: glycosyltransferase, partial [Pararhizobium sp.]
MTEIANVFIGFDTKEVAAYHVLCQSILEKSSIPVAFTPIVLSNVGNIFTRERNALQSTEFSFSRFLVPY